MTVIAEIQTVVMDVVVDEAVVDVIMVIMTIITMVTVTIVTVIMVITVTRAPTQKTSYYTVTYVYS